MSINFINVLIAVKTIAMQWPALLKGRTWRRKKQWYSARIVGQEQPTTVEKFVARHDSVQQKNVILK